MILPKKSFDLNHEFD